MKTRLAILSVLACVGPTSSAFSNKHIERKLILSGKVVPVGTKTYVAGLRVKRDSDSLCGGSLISPTHVLTTSHCALYGFHWVSIGEHYRNGTEIGEQIKIVSLMNHPNYSEHVQYADDFMVVELERPSKYAPVKLAAADDSDFEAGKMATTMGWGTNAEVGGNFSYELQRVDVPLVSDESCAAYATVDSSMVCAGGVANQDACEGDSGGPLIVESATGEDVLVGLVGWAKDDTCGHDGYYGVYSRVSSARAWIETITGGDGTCRS